LNGARRSRVINSLLVLLWLNFIVLWQVVRQSTAVAEALGSIALLVGTIALYGVLLAVWIYHNIRIWRKKGPRLGLRKVSNEVRRDVLSREILPEVALKSDQDIEVYVRGDQKVFANASNSA
jgi:hypothetical protein